jgi:uncharacterized membrane protein YgcG
LAPYLAEIDFDPNKKQANFQAESLLSSSEKEFSIGLLDYHQQFFGYTQEQQRTEWRFPVNCGRGASEERLVGLTAQHYCESRKINVGINTTSPEAALDVNGLIKARKGCLMHGLLELMDCEHMAGDVCAEIFILKQRLSRLEGGGGGGGTAGGSGGSSGNNRKRRSTSSGGASGPVQRLESFGSTEIRGDHLRIRLGRTVPS